MRIARHVGRWRALRALACHDATSTRAVRPKKSGLDNAAASLARTICPNAQTYVERPMVLPRDTGARQQTSELPDFSQVRGLRRLGPGRYTITSLRQRLLEEGRGCFYATEPDSDSESDSYDPTRECFHIDGAVETIDETQDAVAGGRAPIAREDPRTHGNDGHVDPRLQEDRAAQLAQLRELKAKLDEDRERLVLLEQISSRTSHTRLAEVSADRLEKYIDRSSETGSLSSPSAVSLERARTSWRQQCCYAICPNCRTPMRDTSETRCRLCSKWRQFSRLRARPLDIEVPPRRSMMSQPRTKRRCRSISSRPLEGRRQHLSSTTPSTINGDTTHDATSTSIVAVDMGTQKTAVTAPTAAGDTTATRTG